MREVDVAIIGAGSAGGAARREVAQITNNYVVIDDGPLGTTCARVGCMPSKVLIQSANDFARRHKLSQEGINGGESLTVDTKQTMVHVRALRDRFVRAVMSGVDTWKDDKLIAKRASFIDNNTLQVGDEVVKAKSIIIANGSTPNIPPLFEDYKHFCITTDQFFELEDLPKNVLVVGTGVIGLELGQAIHNLGINTWILGRRGVVAGITDPEINEYVVEKFQASLNLCFDPSPTLKEVDGQLEITTQRGVFLADKVLMVAGRTSNISSLDLGNTTAVLHEDGVPNYDLQTFLVEGTNNLFIAGDVTNQKTVLHEASDEGRIAGYNSVRLDQPTKFQTRVPLGITFSDPNIAYVGQTCLELDHAGIDYAVGKVLFEGQGRSIVKLKEIGMLKVYGDKKSGKLLGAELFAPEGEHLAHLLSWAISMNLTVVETLALPFYHPVIEEGLRTALRDLRDACDFIAPPLEIPIVE
jgi:dihydrolipoamide dehydrogenase